ncbi:diacylglycerol/lipid kinase family protein [Odoribacter lunatus]|uniref:diacylglycerol/lipid kinase family protein n=1 Tax=Odoribacter lunatus TaxID=2941335 RepID=UPI00203A86C3|nr:diacylglycerol kinase family protein [Odoribacter lunatus]
MCTMESEDRENKAAWHLLFIVNPISGVGAGKKLPDKIKELPEYRDVAYDIRFTEYAGHARTIVQEALQKGTYTHIVAVGGDGTVNEVGTALMGTSVAFAIVSLGSGNGFARHLGYSVHMKKALRQVLSHAYARIDVLEINGIPSLNVSGVGYDAEVAHEFNRFRVRGIISYIWAGLKLWFNYTSKNYRITCDREVHEEKCFILSLANSSQFGNNACIAPHASLRDGLMDVCLLRRPNLFKVFYFLCCFMNGKIDRLSYYKNIQCREVIIEGDISHVHIDGEATVMSSPVCAKIQPGVLKVVVPKFSR